MLRALGRISLDLLGLLFERVVLVHVLGVEYFHPLRRERVAVVVVIIGEVDVVVFVQVELSRVVLPIAELF